MKFLACFLLFVCTLENLTAYSILTKPERPEKVEIRKKEVKQEIVLLESSPKNEVMPQSLSSYNEDPFAENNPNTDIFQAEEGAIRHEGRDRKRFVLVLKKIAPNFLSVGEKPRISASEENLYAFIQVTKEEQKENIVRDALLIGTINEFGDGQQIRLKISHPFYNCFDNSLSFEILADCEEIIEEQIFKNVFLLVEQK